MIITPITVLNEAVGYVPTAQPTICQEKNQLKWGMMLFGHGIWSVAPVASGWSFLSPPQKYLGSSQSVRVRFSTACHLSPLILPTI